MMEIWVKYDIGFKPRLNKQLGPSPFWKNQRSKLSQYRLIVFMCYILLRVLFKAIYILETFFKARLVLRLRTISPFHVLFQGSHNYRIRITITNEFSIDLVNYYLIFVGILVIIMLINFLYNQSSSLICVVCFF